MEQSEQDQQLANESRAESIRAMAATYEQERDDAPPKTLQDQRDAARRNYCVFWIWVIVVAAIVFVTGWTTGMREIAHTALLTVAGVAFLPLVIIAAGLLLMAITAAVSILASFSGDGGAMSTDGGLVEAGLTAIRPYYRWLFGRKNPIFWGFGGGLLIGGLTLAAVLYFVVLPGEKGTVMSVLDTQEKIESYYEANGHYPEADADGRLTWQAIGLEKPADAASEVITDGFGNPLRFTVNKKLKLTLGYALTSDGFDGEPGIDDMAVQGSTKLGKLVDMAKSVKDIATKLKNGEEIKLNEYFKGIGDMRITAKQLAK